MGGNPANDAAPAPGEEELDLGVVEEGILLRVQVLAALESQRSNPVRLSLVKAVGELEKVATIPARPDRAYLDFHDRHRI